MMALTSEPVLASAVTSSTTVIRPSLVKLGGSFTLLTLTVNSAAVLDSAPPDPCAEAALPSLNTMETVMAPARLSEVLLNVTLRITACTSACVAVVLNVTSRLPALLVKVPTVIPPTCTLLPETVARPASNPYWSAATAPPLRCTRSVELLKLSGAIAWIVISWSDTARLLLASSRTAVPSEATPAPSVKDTLSPPPLSVGASFTGFTVIVAVLVLLTPFAASSATNVKETLPCVLLKLASGTNRRF